MSDTEFNRLIEAQKHGEIVPADSASSSAELDTRRSKSALSASALGSGSGQEIIGWDDNDQGPIMGHGPAVATPHSSDVALGPNDVMFGDGDEGIIASGPRVEAAPAVAQAPAQDIIFGDGDEGGTPVDLSAYAGQSTFALHAPEATDAQVDVGATMDDTNQ
jgi:hypothetical protein